MYKQFFGLSEAPFSISPNPKFFYLSRHHREALSMLKHGTQESGGFILFTGEVGTGKTVILRTMMQEILERNEMELAVIFNPALSLIELLETICHEFGIDFAEGSSKRVLLQHISDFLTENYRKGRRALLMIDEAQHLDDELIEQVRLLTNIETDNTKLLQVILVGQPELQEKFRSQHMRQISQRITARFHLLPLSIYEVDSYIRFRMQSAGCVQVIFSQGAVRELYKVSGGIPRIINVCCDRALLAAYVDNSHTVERRHMLQAVHEVMGTKGFVATVREYLASGNFLNYGMRLTCGVLLAAAVGLGTGYLFCHRNPVELKQDMVKVLKADKDIISYRESIREIKEHRAEKESIIREQTRYRTDVLNSSFEEEAWKKLQREWGFANATGNADTDCAYLKSAGFMCFSGNGSLSELERYNVPAVISLLDEKLRPFYAVLLKLNDNYAVLLINNREWVVPRDFVAGAMEGNFRLIWPLPDGEERVSRRSSQAAQIKLFDMLNRYENTDAHAFNGYDKTMVNRVKKAQETLGLKPDGYAGIDTLWALLPYADTEHSLYEEYIASAEYENNLQTLVDSYSVNPPENAPADAPADGNGNGTGLKENKAVGPVTESEAVREQKKNSSSANDLIISEDDLLSGADGYDAGNSKSADNGREKKGASGNDMKKSADAGGSAGTSPVAQQEASASDGLSISMDDL